jgi:structure-specific recognition protein 1
MSSDGTNKKERFVKGLSWGSYSLTGDRMNFTNNSKEWFDIPFNSLSSVGISKNDITLEFNKDDDNNDSAICELRLFVPEVEVKKENKKKKEEKGKDENEENGEEKEENEEDDNINYKKRSELLKEDILRLAGIGSISDFIAHIPDIQAVIPRGKFDIYFFKDSLKIHGQSHNYQIKRIKKVLLVPKIDGHFSFLVIKLDQPITQGNTSYPFLIFQIVPDNEISVDLVLPEDDEETKKKLENLDNPIKGKTIDVIEQLFKNILGKGLIIPSKSATFSKGPFIKCSYKANDGALYFLEKTILFLHKPVLYIELESIKEIELARIHESGLQQRSFDITIKVKNEKDKENASYQFSGLDREEMDNLQKFLETKKIKIKSVDEDNNNIEIPNITTRKRAPVNEEIPNLPSEDELGDDDYSDSGEASDEDEDEEKEEDEEEKRKKKNKKKKKE